MIKLCSSIKDKIIQENNVKYYDAVGVVRSFAKELGEQLMPGIPVIIETGFEVRSGRQFKVIASFSSGFKKTIIVVYIPINGFPSSILFEGTKKTVNNIDELEDCLFLTVPENLDFQSTIRSLVALGND